MTVPTTAKDESSASFYSWTFPGSPIRINVPLDLISRFRNELEQNVSLAKSGGTEVGGVLLGRPKGRTTLDIDDYVWISSEQQRGSQYHLDESILKRLRSVYTFVVGYFRTQPEDNLQLRDEEVSFVGKHFPDSTNVVLLIQTSRQPYSAGFFFWMEPGALAPFSVMDFPLDAELLGIKEGSKIETPATSLSQEVEMTLPLLAPCGKNADELLNSAFGSAAEPISAAADGQPTQTEPTKNSLVRIPQRMLLVTGLVFAVLSLAGLVGFLFREGSLAGFGQKAPAISAAFPLQLTVEAQGNGLNIRWNSLSASVAKGREGHLVIVEGDKRPRIIPLSLQLLTSGHVYYRSLADRLQLQLEIVDNSGNVSRESVLVLSSKP